MKYQLQIFENGSRTPSQMYETDDYELADTLTDNYTPGTNVTSFKFKRFYEWKQVGEDWTPLKFDGIPACECRVCGQLTVMLGTKLCDSCYSFRNGYDHLTHCGISVEEAVKILKLGA